MEDSSIPVPLTREETREAAREAIKAWMDDKFMQFGKWSLASIGVAALGLLGYLLVIIGSHK